MSSKATIRRKLKRKRARQRFLERFGKCKRCHSTENLTIDHILARALGGANSQDNWQVLCEKCNNRKSVGEGIIAQERHGISIKLRTRKDLGWD